MSDSIQVKSCYRCKESKGISEFHNSSQRQDGLAIWCKDCVSTHAKATRALYRQRSLKSQQAWRDRNRQKVSSYAKTQSVRYPLKHSARNKLRNELKTGRVVRGPCEICGAVKVDAHHNDYSKPLEVRWFCRRHHSEHHHGNH